MIDDVMTSPPAGSRDGVRGVAWWAMVSSTLAPIALIGGWMLAATLQPPGYDPVTQTISTLAARGATDRWLMTGAFVVIGCCHLATALGLRSVRPLARIVLGLAFIAALGLAVFPEPANGSGPVHMFWTGFGAFVLGIWPVLSVSRAPGRPAVLGVRCVVGVTVVFAILLAALYAEAHGGHHLGTSERVATAAETVWPMIVVGGIAWHSRRPPAPTPAAEKSPAR